MWAKHLADMASSASASKRMAIAVENTVAERDKEIISLKDAVTLNEEKLATTEERLRQSTEQNQLDSAKCKASEAKVAELEKELAKYKELAGKHAEEAKGFSAKVDYYRSAAYTEEVITLFQQSEEYDAALTDKAFVFYDRGSAHVLRQFHHLIPDKKQMWKVFEGTYSERQFRGGADFVPFSEEELKEITEADSKSGDTWAPPPAVHPNFFELCDQFRNEPETPLEQPEDVPDGEPEVTPTEVAVVTPIEAAPSTSTS